MPGGSTSISDQSSAATGAITFAPVSIGGKNSGGGNGLPVWVLALVVIVPGGLIAFGIWYFLKNKKG